MKVAKKKAAKPRQDKPHAMAYVREEGPCTNCGSEWHRPGFVWTKEGEMEERVVCANIWCDIIAQLKAQRLMLARLASESPQFDNPLHVYDAQKLRDTVLNLAKRAEEPT